MKDRLVLWLAQGFGAGRAPVAPGTFGSAAGILWFLILLGLANPWIFALGLVAGIFASFWLCGEGERILKQKDPGSVVMDEIIAIPICFVGWVAFLFTRNRALVQPQYFIADHRWVYLIAVFALFRFFDVVKPWPVRQSQSLPGGIGVTVDDVLAAIYVNIVIAAYYLGRRAIVGVL
jgi:phosphatidylglycerophosphatase A